MPNYECPDDCGKTYQSIKAALMCRCQYENEHGYPVYVHGSDWLP